MYKSLTDKLLFDYFMIDCCRKDSIFSPFPFYMEEKLINEITHSVETIDSLVQKIIVGINTTFSDFKMHIPYFPNKEYILDLQNDVSPIFWARYDTFIKENGGIFFSEFNYDKPCAQREILASEYLEAENNVNYGFKEAFTNSFKEIIINFFNEKRKFNIAVLIDPCHVEECHLSYLYKDILEDDYFKLIQVGPSNLKVKNGSLIAFNRDKIDVILRQFPTEHLNELASIKDIIKLFNDKKILILNDPRVIVGQCKTLFSYLWELAAKSDSRLSKEEINVIRKTIPYTTNFHIKYLKELKENKDSYVLKPVYGRYSEDVFIGKLYSKDEWAEILDYVKNENSKDFILQEFCPIHADAVTAISKDRCIPKEAFCNLGTYLINGKVKGFCTRWNESYLTDDDSTFITPIGKINPSIEVIKAPAENRKNIWREVTDEAFINYNFTGSYANQYEYVALDSLLLEKSKFNELKKASEDICKIFKKTQKVVSNNIDIFAPILGIDGLNKLAVQNYTDSLVFLGRMDWCLTNTNEWKLLEFNSETPAGTVEAMNVSEIIRNKLNITNENPNSGMKEIIKNEFVKIIKDYEKIKNIKNISVLSTTYYEDWYTALSIYNIIKDLPYDISIGNIYDTKVHKDKVHLYGKPLDAIFRYYPLDWFKTDNNDGFLKALELNTLSINPPHTIITQSKAFFAVIFELKNQGFFNNDEKATIEKYIAETSLDAASLNTSDICIKPLLDREGNKVKLGFETFNEPSYNTVFQKRELIKPIDFNVYSTVNKYKKLLYPIIGTYISGDKFCGVYSRLGNIITTNHCVYSPVFLK